MSTDSQLSDSNVVDLAWAAGFIDGEGCISIHKHKSSRNPKYPRFTLRLTVSNTKVDVLNQCKEIFGCGTVTLDQLREDKNWKQGYRWTVTCDSASRVLKQLIPYLRVKRRQAETGIEFQSRLTLKGKDLTDDEVLIRLGYWQTLKELNHVGK
jgi:hypothetical protein